MLTKIRSDFQWKFFEIISFSRTSRLLSDNENVIVEIFNEQNDDAENMVVLETEPTDYTPVTNGPQNMTRDDSQEHGYLVAQILETQRELAKDNAVDLIANKVDTVRKPIRFFFSFHESMKI